MLTLNDGRAELWQWDTGRTLSVDADCSQVHFSNKVFGRSIDVDVADGVAVIPDILLQTDKDLNVWAFVGTAENGYTKISKTFTVNRRNKPADYVFTPQDQTSLEEIKEKIDYLESIQDPDAIKNAVEDYLEKNPVEAPVQSVNGRTGEVELTAEDVGAISQGDLQEATNEALAQAKASGEFDGADGAPGRDGADGITPTIGDNGNWYLGDTDTGKPSRGEPGQDGADGKDGAPGAAGADGHTPVKGTDYFTEADKQEIAESAAGMVSIPDKLPNPNALTFTGAVTGSYDGSAPLSVEIPSGGGSGGASVEGWRLLNTITVDAETSYAGYDKDDGGNAFAVKSIMVVIDTLHYNTGSYVYLQPYTNGSMGKIAFWPSNSKRFTFVVTAVDGKLILESAHSSGGSVGGEINDATPDTVISSYVIGSSNGWSEATTMRVYGRDF